MTWRSCQAASTLLGALLAAVAAQERPPAQENAVRLELRQGEVVEGRLDGFADRVYRVRGADGVVREVREEDVARVEFGGGAAPAGRRRAAAELAAEVLARAEASGALAARILGTQRFLITETVHADLGSDRPAPRPNRWLLQVEVALEGEQAARELRLELEVIPEPGNGRDPELPRIDADGLPMRVRWWVGLDGRARRAEALSSQLVARWARAGGRWTGVSTERGRTRRTDDAWHDDLLPDAFLVLVLGPLHDQGLPPGAVLRLLRTRKNDGAATLRRLRLLPGEREVAGVPVRALELVKEHYGKPSRGELRLFLAAGGPVQGRLVRLECEAWGSTDGVDFLRAGSVYEPIDEAAFEALLREWKRERPPLAPAPAPAPALPQPEADLPPDEVATRLAAARREGRLGPWERWYVTRASDAVRAGAAESLARSRAPGGKVSREALGHQLRTALVILTRVALRHEGERTTLEVTRSTVGDPERDQLASCSFDAEGRLVGALRRHRMSGSLYETRWERRGALLHRVQLTRREAQGSWPGDEERDESSVPLRAGMVPEEAWVWLLPCVGLPPRLRVDGFDTGEYELRGPRPVGEDGLRLFERGGPLPFPPGPRPERAWLLGREEGRGGLRPLQVVWLSADGEHLGLTTTEWMHGWVGDHIPHVPRITSEAAAALAGDERAVEAAQAVRRIDREGSAGLHLWMIQQSQVAFRAMDPDLDGEPDWAGSIEELARSGHFKGPLSCGEEDGYRFELISAGERWLAVANPIRPGVDGDRSYAITEEGRVLVSPEPIAASPDARAPAGLVPDPDFERFPR